VARAAGRSIRRRPAGQRGQTLLIFALCATVVFALVGLAVDGGISYLSSQQLEKAAAAAATAGVTYMPQGFTCGPGPCTSAVAQEVDATAQANGVGLGGPEDVTITDYQVPGTCGEAGQ
jgi:Flp pilus assembly protein TadG